MRTVKKIIRDQKDISEVKGLIEVYEEIAADNMRRVRAGILNSRDYFDGLAKLSTEVGADLQSAGLGRSGEAAVFISASTGLYGDIIDKVFVSFMNFIKQNPGTKMVVIGKLGDNMMKTLAPGKVYDYYDLKDEKMDLDELALVVKELVTFKKIYLFYGKFENIVSQETWTSSISGRVLEEIQELNLDKNKFLYLYEPSITTIAKVFAEEIAGSVFDQAIHESELAKYASRLMYLDAAIEKVNEKLGNLFIERNKAVKRAGERKQLVTFAGIINR